MPKRGRSVGGKEKKASPRGVRMGEKTQYEAMVLRNLTNSPLMKGKRSRKRKCGQ